MNKKLFIITHKETDDILDGYDLLQVGNENTFCNYRDNTLDNISSLNHLYLETTGIYWIWKNIHADIKGHVQVRRWLDIDINDIDNVLENYDIICATPFNYNPELQYKSSHLLSDLTQCKFIMRDLGYNPMYYDLYITRGTKLYYSNCFICKEETYNDICNFCFSILNEFVKRNNFSDYDTLYNHASQITWGENPHKNISMTQYQMRICGALFERLFTLYIQMKNLKKYHVDYILREDNMKI